uniref:Uncharacterized protein n=1 Tax=Peronospora matthiolae TaxID=2874970 RepID=A0AAV1VGF5_9STRA
MKEGKKEPRSQMDLQVQSDTVSQLKRVTCELREELEHERGRRLDLLGNVSRLFSKRGMDRSNFALINLKMSGHTILFATS